MFSTNFIAIIVVLVAMVVALFIFYKKIMEDAEALGDDDNITSLAVLETTVNEVVVNTIRQQLKDLDLDENQMKQREALKNELRRAQYDASHGDSQAKSFMKKQIIRIITDTRNQHHVTPQNINDVMPFDIPSSLKTVDKFEILLYWYMNKELHEVTNYKTGETKLVSYGSDGMKQLMKDYSLDAPVQVIDDEGNPVYDDEGNPKYYSYYDITAEKIEEAYELKMEEMELTYDDKLNILAQRIFEDLWGFSKGVDILLDTSVDEVQGGVSGMPAGAYDIKNLNPNSLTYSYESIWIVSGGRKIRISALSFGTQDELVRVVQNIYKYETPRVLSKKNGNVVATTKSGARVVVFRPPFALSFGFIVRKFDSAPSIAPDKLLRDRGSDIAILVSKWLIKGMFNTAITGEQGTGKTTWLKSMIRFIPEDLSIRTQELTRELNLNFTYPNRNIISFVETESVSAQEGLDFQKKTSGDINIIGEVATAIAASWIIQTAKVASRMTMFTHHAKTWHDLVVAIRNNVMECGSYSNERSVDQLVAECINIDMHFEVDPAENHRWMERITYIYPVFDIPYPEPDLKSVKDDKEFVKSNILNEDEFRKRLTDRVTFDAYNLVEYDRQHNRYKYIGISEEVVNQIKKNVSKNEYIQFKKDMQTVQELERKYAEEDELSDNQAM